MYVYIYIYIYIYIYVRVCVYKIILYQIIVDIIEKKIMGLK